MLALFTFALYILIVCSKFLCLDLEKVFVVLTLLVKKIYFYFSDGVDLRFVEELPPTHCESYNERNISEFQELG